MIYYTVEVRTKWRGHDHEYLETTRENFLDVIEHLKCLKYIPFEIREIVVKQYAFSEFLEEARVALLNCFDISFTGNNMCGEPIFTLYNVSRII